MKGGPHQQISGAQVHRCGCSLPGLAGFTVYCRGGTSTDRGAYNAASRPMNKAHTSNSYRLMTLQDQGESYRLRLPYGEVAEWLKAHAWKACVP